MEEYIIKKKKIKGINRFIFHERVQLTPLEASHIENFFKYLKDNSLELE
jgi:hypothetical protein